ncbi:hypothetical protein M0812_13423 [Anaeramoeba flamelloides]|uniref:Aminotransferase class I/classII large domain-containing protein n=1 Tax=Anaeramoeba flamelloides TaxID=1746091 RepID=A0AAV7ZL56_9EUKA|nr:hypothetical protein M0812_13423 [Anaeramoeba flamelloides]|eukprot:Anaeramoba_flamelloidesa1054514_372.p1 GENE.a1054514_372~~a1054514_372.p1  ORF type:complete len:507 (+),score=109.83 a1054514_372:82-1602(+)
MSLSFLSKSTSSFKTNYSMLSRRLSRPLQMTVDTLNPKVLKTKYAVRGTVVIRSMEIEEEIRKNPNSYPFDKITSCNIGNPQVLKQKPITFFRDVLSLVQNPRLIDHPEAKNIFKGDVLERAKEIMFHVPGGVGAYTHSQGIPYVRECVSKFIEKRDGYAVDPNDIFLTGGASQGVKDILTSLIRDNNDGIMISIPQYPLYSASIALLGGNQINYYLDEENDWGLSRSELDRAIQKPLESGVNVRAICVINPGNPTGQCLSAESQKGIIDFCLENNLVLMADEVYQENVYYKKKKPFYSFRKIALDMGSKAKDLQMISFHSVSKGFIGECGQRGGYYQTHGIPTDVKGQLYKMASISLCPNTGGQIMTSLMVNPPKKGEESYNQYIQERDNIYNSLKRRSIKLANTFNAMEGVTCNMSEGALYLFPNIRVPEKAKQEAKKKGINPSTLYAISCLEQTGICIVPGAGFGQKEGTFHIRTTFLPPEDQFDDVTRKLSEFHKKFMNKYR